MSNIMDCMLICYYHLFSRKGRKDVILLQCMTYIKADHSLKTKAKDVFSLVLLDSSMSSM